MRRLRRWWRTRGHDMRDINCIYWTGRGPGFAVCGPCEATGGYVAHRHAEIDGTP